MDKKPSEYIDGFLKFIREAPEACNIAKMKEADADMETQDILHWLEFNAEDEKIDKLETARAFAILKLTGTIRRTRRKAKKESEILEPVVEWGLGHTETIKSLEQLLGDVRKKEKAVNNRTYAERTNIMRQVFGEDE